MKIPVEIEEYSTKFKFDLTDLFELLDDDARQELIEHLAWQSPIWDEIVRAVRANYASDNMSPTIHKLRLAFFQEDEDGHVDKALKELIKNLLDTITHLHDERRSLWSANGKWRKWYRSQKRFGSHPVPFPRHELRYVIRDDVQKIVDQAKEWGKI